MFFPFRASQGLTLECLRLVMRPSSVVPMDSDLQFRDSSQEEKTWLMV